jgi:hypothetical protein
MLLMAYLTASGGRKRGLLVMIPSAVTMVGCLFVPVAYLRYALPYVCSLPLWFAAYYGAAGPTPKAAVPVQATGEVGGGSAE